MAPSKEKLLRLAHVARRYYLEDWKQIDIARELGVSRPLVSRMLAEARELGVVEITVHEPGAKRALSCWTGCGCPAPSRGASWWRTAEDDDATNQLLSQGAVDLLRQIGARRLGVGWGHLIGQLVTWLEENPQPRQHRQLISAPWWAMPASPPATTSPTKMSA